MTREARRSINMIIPNILSIDLPPPRLLVELLAGIAIASSLSVLCLKLKLK